MKILGLTMVGLMMSVGLAQSPPIIRVPVRVVSVPTAVVSTGGQFVRGLHKEDFRLYDDNREQKFDFDYIDEPMSLAIVVQNNDAVRAWLPQVRRVASVVEVLVIGERGEASLSLFSDEIRTLQPLTSSSALLDKAFQLIRPSFQDKSRTLDALLNAATELKQASVQRRRVILLIGQAEDLGSMSNVRDVLGEFERDNIVVYSLVMPRVGKDLIQKEVSLKDAKTVFRRDDVGFVAGIDLSEVIPEIFRAEKASAGKDDLTIVTSELGGRQIPFRTLHDLEMALSTIAEELHTEYVLSYTPDLYNPGYHRIQVRLNHSDSAVRARPGYYALETDGQR